MIIQVGDILKHRRSGSLFLVLEQFKGINTYLIRTQNEGMYRAGLETRFTYEFLRDTCYKVA